jgi:hypothetical protein
MELPSPARRRGQEQHDARRRLARRDNNSVDKLGKAGDKSPGFGLRRQDAGANIGAADDLQGKPQE